VIRQASRRANDVLAKNPDHLADDLDAENTGGLLTGFLAEEDEFDRRALWRLGSWGVGAVGAVTIAVMANQTSISIRHDQIAAADLARQAQQIQLVARESQGETRRLASAIDTLNSDRDRLYSRVTTLEQGLDSVTGAIARQSNAAPAAAASSAPAQSPAAQPVNPAPAPSVAPVASAAPTTQAASDKPAAVDKPVAASDKPPAATGDKPPAVAADKLPVFVADAGPGAAAAATADAAKAPSPSTPLVASKSMMGPPDPAAGKLVEPAKPANPVTAAPIPEVVAAAPAAGETEAEDSTAPKAALQRTEFGVDLGGANSVAGLRALWRGLLKTRANAPIFDLRPIIVIKEGTNGLGLQLRLVAGPLRDAGVAAKICAVLAENNRRCETTVFDGQRLTMKDEAPSAGSPPAPAKPPQRRRSAPKRAAAPPPVAEEAPKKPEGSTFSSLFGRKGQ
jgi:hypothetical protein